MVVHGGDFPWLSAHFSPRGSFDEVRPLFEDSLSKLDDNANNMDAWEAAFARIRAAVDLAAPDDHRVAEFILHIDGNEAWWRWSDEPFDEPDTPSDL